MSRPFILRDAWNLSMERGLGTRGLIMSQVELQARIKEQQDFQKEMKLKYRGVAYTKLTNN